MRRAIVVLALLAACGKDAPQHPNVLLVTIDTLRPDAIGPGTPALNGFLLDATRFSAARTVAPLALPAHASIFTGLFPKRHGIHDNVAEPLPPREGRSFPLLAEQFRDAGYATAAFVARDALAAPTGISSGFDLYDCPPSPGPWEEGCLPGEERIRAAVEWIEGAPRGRPWFVWVHLFDPHAPYQAFAGDAQRASTRESDPPAVRYAGEVRRADAAFERLIRAVAPDTVVVLASDHGEGLREHGEPTHGPLCYGSTIDAVLALRAPGFDPGAVDRGLRSVADIAPTLRRICHLPPFEGDALDLGGPSHRTLVAESLFAWGVHGWGQAFAATDGRMSVVESGETLELFDRSEDPGETAPLPLDHPAYEKLDRALERHRAGKSGGAGGEGGEMLAPVAQGGELRRPDVGYLSRHENARLANPRDHMEAWSVLARMPALIQASKARRDAVPLERALQTLDAVEKTSTTPQLDHYRAGALAALGDITGTKARYREAAWAELAAIEKGYVVQGAIVPAIDYAVASSDAEALRTLVRLLRRSGRRIDTGTRQALEAAAGKLDVSEAESSLGGG